MMDEEEDGSQGEEDSLPSGSFDTDEAADQMMITDENEESVRYIGPLSEVQRLKKVRNYWNKKQRKAQLLNAKHTYL